MATFLFKWNPDRWPWNTLQSDIGKLRRRSFFDDYWSCGVTKSIRKGDRAFLLRTVVPPRGIVGAGVVTEEPFEDKHWDESRPQDKALYVGVRFDSLLDPAQEPVLPIERLDEADLASAPWHVQGSGKSIPPDTAAVLEQVWAAFLKGNGQSPSILAEEVVAESRFFEGATRRVSVNAYERNAVARQRCIDVHKCRCSVCEFDFEAVYGEVGRGFIHVHHLKPLSEVGQEYEVDPVRDLRPVCPNCHAMIHAGNEMLSIEALRALIRKHAR